MDKPHQGVCLGLWSGSERSQRVLLPGQKGPWSPRGMQKPLRLRAQGQGRGEAMLPRSHRCRAQKDTKHKKWDKTWRGKLDSSDHCSR